MAATRESKQQLSKALYIELLQTELVSA